VGDSATIFTGTFSEFGYGSTLDETSLIEVVDGATFFWLYSLMK
jgi:hypothetical protein